MRYESPRDLVKNVDSALVDVGRTWNSALQTSFQLIPMLLVLGPLFDKALDGLVT